MRENSNDDFQVIVSNLDDNTVLLTENSDKELSVDEMWNKVLEQSAYDFQGKQHQYSTILNEKSYGSNDSITVDDIEEYSNNPQNDLSTIQKINKIIKSFVNKDDIIGRVYECIQMYINTSYDNVYNDEIDVLHQIVIRF